LSVRNLTERQRGNSIFKEHFEGKI
jgi:hypothetical protein